VVTANKMNFKDYLCFCSV